MAVKDVATRVAEEWKGLTSAEKEVSHYVSLYQDEEN